jgi:hypothetical protein
MEEVNHWVKVENGSDVSIRDSFKENEYLFSAKVWSPEFTFSKVSNPKTTTRDGETTLSFTINPLSEEAIRINFPVYNFECKKYISIKSNEIVFDLYDISRRIRNYFAYKFGERVPVEAKIIGKGIILPIIFDSKSPLKNDIDEVLNHKETSDKKFLDKCDSVLWLINSVKQNSLIDKLVNLFGSSIWSDDISDSFMYLWRTIELFSKDFIANISENDLGEFKSLLKVDELNSVLSESKMGYKIKIAMRKFLPSEDESKIKEYNKLRNQIAHGDITVDTYKGVTSNINKVSEIAKRLIEIKINEINQVK